jgi:hypothetical protein
MLGAREATVLIWLKMPSPSWPKLPLGALTRFQTSAQGGRARLSLRLRQ